MSIQWTLIAGYLYLEVAVVIIMILPIFSPRKWNTFFKSRLFATFREHAAWYFYALLLVLTLFLMDAVRDIRKYSHKHESVHIHLTSEMKDSVKLFRAQRNLYITGFAIFLSFVIKRLVTMIVIQYEVSCKVDELKNKITKTEESYRQINNQLTITEGMLKVEQDKVKELSDDASKWRIKYEELAGGDSQLA